MPMKAALRVVTACVNVMLFLLSSSNAARLLALLTTLGAWWWLSDYYFAPWPWWMDRYAFIVRVIPPAEDLMIVNHVVRLLAA